MYAGTLFRLKSSHQNLRSDSVEGKFIDLPDYGKEFSMTAPGLHAGVRFVRTTPVEQIRHLGDAMIFSTANSTYALTYRPIEKGPEEESDIDIVQTKEPI